MYGLCPPSSAVWVQIIQSFHIFLLFQRELDCALDLRKSAYELGSTFMLLFDLTFRWVSKFFSSITPIGLQIVNADVLY